MRRLSAIMFTDIVGYSALTQQNEQLALDLLEEHRVILRAIFVKYDGREIETAGDSFFVEFNSAVEAVNCAIDIQSTLHERNKTVDRSRTILLRIGMHIGDVVYMEQHVHGDGVNIAARLEPLALPGGIAISEDVARQIRNKIDYPVKKAGAERLKNISMPMDVYCIVLPWLKAGVNHKQQPSKTRKILMYTVAALIVVAVGVLLLFSSHEEAKASSSLKYRLAVLPLKNISNDKNDEYFADGMTEELISSIARIGGLNVIARTSIMKYKETTKDVGQIGKELMVGTVLEGSVRKSDNKARITVQLVDVAKQENLWSEDFDRELSDIFSIQSEIATRIAKELKVRLVESEMKQADHSTTSNMNAYQEYLIGKHFLNQRTSGDIKNSITHFEKSIQYDSGFALPYPALAYAYTLLGAAGYGGADRAIADGRAKAAIEKALQLDPNLAETHAAAGYVKFRIDWNWEGAEKDFRKAIDLKPGYSTAHEWYALYLAVRGRLDEALREIMIAYDLDPLSSSVNTGIARIYHFRNEDEKSLEQIRKTLNMDPTYAEAHFTAGMTYHKMKNYAEAERELKKAIELSGRRPVMLGMLGANYVRMGRKDDTQKILNELQTPPLNNDKRYAIATIKVAMGEIEENLATFEELVKEKYGIMIYMKVQKDHLGFNKHPRFDRLLKEIGL